MNIKKFFETKEYKELKPLQKYKINCVICGVETITQKDTANEGICYNCRIK